MEQKMPNAALKTALKTALVTGASAGIGEATVKHLLADGYVVYAAARRVDRMAPLAAAGARLIALDLTDDASIVAAVEQVRNDAGRLDVLVNNAGYGSYGAVEDVPLEEARRQFEVNLFGAARLIQLALPMMRAQNSGRIVNVSSIGGKFGTAFGAWYHATKHALEGLSDSLRMELIPFGIDVIVIEPGAIRTEWGGIAHESLLARSGDTAYGPYARRLAAMFRRATSSRLPSPPEKVANVIAEAVKARRSRTRYPVAGGASVFLFVRRVLSDRMFDRLMWSISQA
jgi:NAD(P)-dependent dehydrogenase (short-subunit alcohol dehydrogenase family)